MGETLHLAEVEEWVSLTYLDMVAEFESAGEGYPFNDVELAKRDFGAFVRDLRDERDGVGLPPGVVPQTTLVLLRPSGRALGEFRFRPSVPPPYTTNSGHVGYNIRPSERRKGYATLGLALVIERARTLGLEGLMLPVNGENPGSVRAIEKHGGVLAQSTNNERGEVTSHYWIAL